MTVRPSSPARLFRALCCLLLPLAAGCAHRLPDKAILPPDVLREFRSYEIPRVDGPMDVKTAVALALKHDPDLAVLRDDVRVADANRSAAVQIDSPQLRFSTGSGDRTGRQFSTVGITNTPWFVPGVTAVTNIADTATGVTTDYDEGQHTAVTLRLYPPNPFTLKYRVSETTALLLAAVSKLRGAEWSLATEVLKTYETVHHLKQDMEFLNKLVLVEKEMTKKLEKGAAAGEATLMDMMDVSRRYLRVLTDLDKARRDHDKAVRDLADITGTTASTLTVPSERPALPSLDPAIVTLKVLETAALEHRSDLAALLWEYHAASAAAGGARAQKIPWFSYLQASYSRDTRDSVTDRNTAWTTSDGGSVTVARPSISSSDLASQEWRIDAGISIPIFSLFTRPEDPSIAEQHRRKTILTAGWKNTLTQIHNRFSNVLESRESLRLYKDSSGPHMARMRKLLKNLDVESGLDPDDAAKTAEVIVLTERTQARLVFEYRMALISLQEAVGRDLDLAPRESPKKRRIAPPESEK